MQSMSRIVAVSVMVALLGSVQGCAWTNSMVSKVRDKVASIRDKNEQRRAERRARAEAEAAQAAQTAAAQPAPEVAAQSAATMAAGEHHVGTGTTRVLRTSSGECVNLGHAVGSGHVGGDCGDGQMAKAMPDKASSGAPPEMGQAEAPSVETVPLGMDEPVNGQRVAPAPVREAPADTGMPSAEPEVAMAPEMPEAIEPEQTMAAQEQPMASPEPMQPAPPVVTTPSPAPAAAVTAQAEGQDMGKPLERMTLEADALFAYRGSDLGSMSAAGKNKLANLASQIKQMEGSITGIKVIGHADRLGGEDYNMGLSTRRAATVKNYLASLGIDPGMIVAEGRGESEPVKACRGNKRTKQLVACLAPNRRVEVTIHGQK